MKTIDDFATGGIYHNLYARIFRFHKTHANSTTDEEWDACARGLAEFETPFEIDLAVAVANELERTSERSNTV